MEASWKCAECALVNFVSDSHCKRCGASAVNAAVPTQPTAVGIVLEDGYVLPPPPSTAGIWRDKSTLVMTKDAPLPDSCVKCNAPANGLRLKRKLAWHTPILYLAIFFAVLLYAILAAVLSKRATVYLGLCAEHLQRRRRRMAAGWLLVAVALMLFVGGIGYEYTDMILIGMALLLGAGLWLVIVARTVTVKKIDDRFVWLKGINSDYLAQFPVWHHQA